MHKATQKNALIKKMHSKKKKKLIKMHKATQKTKTKQKNSVFWNEQKFTKMYK